MLIGFNGKSNLVEAISLMRSAPKDMREVTRSGGGVAELVWKVGPKAAASVALVDNEDPVEDLEERADVVTRKPDGRGAALRPPDDSAPDTAEEPDDSLDETEPDDEEAAV